MGWGWNPETVEALATAVAAVAAIAAGIFAGSAYRAERETRALAEKGHAITEDRERRELEDKRRAQAELVAAWAVVLDDAQTTNVEVCIQNLSAAPVYAVSVGFVLTGQESVYARWVRVLAPTNGAQTLRPVKPFAAERWRAWCGGRRPMADPLVEFTFRDTAGRWWLRDAEGVLSEIDEGSRWRYARSEGTSVATG